MPGTKKTKSSAKPTSDEPVWTYRGYSIKSSEFVTAMVHFFRAEVHRANIWRQRLDTTTNWSVVATGATLSFAFSQSEIHHAIIILNTLLVTLFLFIEARRYRYYELWSYRAPDGNGFLRRDACAAVPSLTRVGGKPGGKFALAKVSDFDAGGLWSQAAP